MHVTIPGLPVDYVEALLHGGPPNDNPHALEAWEGGAFKHCVTDGLDPAVVAQAAAVISMETGIRSGPTALQRDVGNSRIRDAGGRRLLRGAAS